MTRAARIEDVAAIALALPRVVEVAAWGGRPAWQVSKKVFCGNRSPRPDAVDADGVRLDDVILIRTPDESDKLALVQADGPFFTTPHFDGYNAVLIRASRLGEITRAELAEVIEDAWCACAPKTVVKAWLAGRAH
ncbi:MmcQ/YjbR family DNA-binding protein [Tsukamurella sp. M9C]|uniref:MmcQ/YjbR family DNA-binding protein n=1 Tax=unclassified Tsukamurella TaxID=2633480 RepID=UPI001CCEC6D7|nr:MmcQ/YjbR family DNA-binding protein [Tsukamurella sp. M9C]MCA0156953.1 MmcQ/YjbR family DNA-binding protein [Tsukamurella sp. M9C]